MTTVVQSRGHARYRCIIAIHPASTVQTDGIRCSHLHSWNQVPLRGLFFLLMASTQPTDWTAPKPTASHFPQSLHSDAPGTHGQLNFLSFAHVHVGTDETIHIACDTVPGSLKSHRDCHRQHTSETSS